MKKTGLWIVALALVVSGCPSPEVRHLTAARQDCPGQSCDLVVYVSGDPAQGDPVVVVDYAELKMKKGEKKVEIVWKLDAKGYEFTSDSIQPKPDSARAWASQISNPKNSKYRYIVENANDQLFTMNYSISVYHPTLKKSFKLDPAIINDP
jgi:hypothetical protein